jgi:hypothetical protein
MDQPQPNAPIVIDLGRQRRKKIKQLRKGGGSLFADVADCLDELKANGEVSDQVQPVIVIVREQRQREPMWGW